MHASNGCQQECPLTAASCMGLLSRTSESRMLTKSGGWVRSALVIFVSSCLKKHPFLREAHHMAFGGFTFFRVNAVPLDRQIFRYCAWCASGHPNEKDYISAKQPLKIVYNKISQASGLPAWGLGFRRQFHRGPFLRASGEGEWQEMVTLRQLRITESLIP